MRSAQSWSATDALAETDRYLEELAAEVGEPNQRRQATADAIARRIRTIDPTVSESAGRRAAELRRRARAGSAVDALVVAIAEPSGTVLTGDPADIEALAAHADAVAVEVV